MQSHAGIVIVGGGVAGCSIAYHLTRLGRRDVLLIEKGEVANGASSWAAGDLPHFAESALVSRLAMESTRLYPELEKETGQAVGWHHTGSLRLALNEGHMTDFRRHAAKARLLGMPFEIIGPNETKSICPLLNIDGVAGAAWTPDDGHIDPASVTAAFAKGARDGGATIARHTTVTGLAQKADGGWRVETDKGVVEAEILVNCGGWWGREVSRMAGHDLPMTLHEHQYIITETIPEIAAMAGMVPMLRDMGAPFYARQEGKGLLCSAYEAAPKFIAERGVPPHLGESPLPPDLDRSAEVLERCIHRLPALGEVGIKRVVNAPVMRSPDGEPMIGPVPGLRNFWVATAFGGGFLLGSFGKYAARWIAEGDPGIDLWPLDVRRLGPHHTKAFTAAKVRARHSYSTDVVYPHAEGSSARPLKTSPLYPVLKEEGAVFGARSGWEVALWYAPAGSEAKDVPSFGRPNWFAAVGEECLAVRDACGLAELPNLCKWEISGREAERMLDRLSAARLPEAGEIMHAPLLDERAKVAASGVLTRLGPDRFYFFAWAEAETMVRDRLERAARGRDVRLDDVTGRWSALILSGPKAREVLQGLCEDELSNEALPVGRALETTVGLAPCWILRIREPGELTYKLHHRAEYSIALRRALRQAGAAHGLRPVGLRALLSLRMEKARPLWGLDVTPAMHALDAGMAHGIDRGKTDFAGKAALDDAGLRGRRLVLLEVEAKDADATGLDLVCRDGRPVGLVTSGWYGHRVGASLAFAHVDPGAAEPGTRLSVEILGEERPATVAAGALYDPEESRVAM